MFCGSEHDLFGIQKVFLRSQQDLFGQEKQLRESKRILVRFAIAFAGPYKKGKGIARDLMREIERLAKDAGFTLLLLDTCKGTAAERFYQSLGWTRVGEVPHFALNPDGTPSDTVFFYRQLSRADERE